MKVWVLTLETNTNLDGIITGVWGVYTSLEKAISAYRNNCKEYGEVEVEWTCYSESLFTFTTNQSTWRIEAMQLDD